jgi:choline dehydrogenase-like flavoprotein
MLFELASEVCTTGSGLQSPSLLELSGIGNREILEPLGIETKVHNPAVGENVQEHLIAAVIWGADASVISFH